MRDPALAAALGILGGPTSNYGVDMGAEMGYGADAGYGADMGFDGGFDGEVGYGADAAMAPVAAAHLKNPHHPAHAHRTQAILHSHYAKNARTASRDRLINPNKGSSIQIQRYDFSLQQSLTMGTAAAILMTVQPAVTLRPQRGTFNAPQLGWATISAILVGNVNGMAGQATDAGIYGPTSVGVSLDLPSINPSNRLQVNGTYSGLVSPGYPANFSYPFTASFQCPATTVPNPDVQV